jgi:basic amino acid/polyamine antiporter, APA family
VSQQKNELKKVLGAGFGIAVLVGGTIGVGILRTPGIIAGLIDNYWLIIFAWLFVGGYVLLAAGLFAEMATMMPKAGGPYNYVKRAFGDYAGFVSGWFDYLLNSIAPAYFCIVIGEYLSLLFPVLTGYETVMGLGFLVLFMLFHLNGVKSGSIAQQVTSVIKVLFFIALVISCFVIDTTAIPVEKAQRLAEGSSILAFLTVLQLIMGAYNGWWSGCFFAEEDVDPSKNIPKSLFTGVIMVIVIYVLLNMAFLHVIPPSALANSPLAASDVARVVFGDSGATLVIVIAIVSILSILNAYMMIPARIMFGLSRDGFFIKQGTHINKGGTPVVSLLITTAFSFVLIIIGSFQQLFALAGFMSLVVTGLAFAAHIKLRRSEPNTPRPYKAWGYPVTPIIVLIATLAMFVGFAKSDQFNFLIVIGVGIISYPAFILIRKTSTTKHF